jgi:polyhydroxyalkanoate synthesis regulator protein
MTMVKNGEKLVVIDAGSENDVTLWYQPIIVEH